ncbi:MAG: PQQ-binding-like beta-propeller repeat protein [Caldisericia bacterium]|nr:PQQ-binding-like beta-propeller repeat protein [Caldisericia bacterium]
MKKIVSFSLVLLMLGFSFLFQPMAYGSKGVPYDKEGNYPWLSIYNNSTLDGYTTTSLMDPLEEHREYPLLFGSYKEYGVSKGIVCYNKQAFFLNTRYKDTDSATLLVYDIEEAEELWSVDVKGNYVSKQSPLVLPEFNQVWVSSTFTVDDILAGKAGGYITSIDLDSHKVLFEIPMKDMMYGSMQYSNGCIFVKSSCMKRVNEGEESSYIESTKSILTKIDAKTGKIIWEKEIPLSGLSDCGIPAIANDCIFVCGYPVIWENGKAIQSNGFASISCFDETTGEKKWTRTFDGFNNICSPSVDNQQIYTVIHKGSNDETYECECLALNSSTGKTNWSFNKEGINAQDFTPKLSKDLVIFTAKPGYIFALQKSSGDIQWEKRIRLDDYFINFSCPGMIIANDKLVFSCWHYKLSSKGGMPFYQRPKKLMMLSMENGKTLEKTEINEDFGNVSSIAVYGKGIVVLNSKNFLTYFEASMPDISIRPTEVDFGEVEQGETSEQTVSIKNHALDGLIGTVSVIGNSTWLEVSPSEIDDDTKIITLTAKTENLEPGEYSESVEILSNGGNKLVSVKMIVIDNTPPKIEINTDSLNFFEDFYYTNVKNLLLQGTTEAGVTLTIKGKEVLVSADGKFSANISLEEGDNPIPLTATDSYGNETNLNCIIVLDTKPPEILVTNEEYQLYKTSDAVLKGKASGCCNLSINEEPVNIDENGVFSFDTSLEKGVNNFVLKAVDRAGNASILNHHLVLPEKILILLQINNASAEVNGQLIKLDVAPLIMKSTTMVPFRFIGESMGAEIEWLADIRGVKFTLYGTTITLKVDNNIGEVNGKKVSLTVPPTIISGRTMIPIRFVSENLGAKVGWNGETREIMITYPNPD